MSILNDLRDKYGTRLKELLAEGQAIKENATLVPGGTAENWVTRRVRRLPDSYRVDSSRFFRWKTNCISLLDAIVPHNHLHRSTVQTFQKQVAGYKNLDWAIGVLSGIGEDFDRELLTTSIAEIEYEVSCDYLDEAKALLSAQGVPDSNITTAAVLTGIALERQLRRLWAEHNIASAGTNNNKRLGLLIDELKKANVINETKAKQLRAWADIRNHAAHGDHEQFTVTDLRHMIDGVKNFLTQLK